MMNTKDSGAGQGPRPSLPKAIAGEPVEACAERWREYFRHERELPAAEIDAALDAALEQLLEDARHAL